MSDFIRFLTAAVICWISVSAFAQSPLVANRSDRSQIVFGYTQWNEATGPMQQYRWQALTHVGYTFVNFDANGDLIGTSLTAFNNRVSELKFGGTAAMNGVKVIVVVRNNNFDETILDTVMQSQSLRQRLADQIVAMVSNTTNGCDGVNLDFEFTWGTATRDGITQFLQYLHPRMKALSPPRELSVYVHPTYSATYYNVAAIRDLMDYMIYSGYDFATGGSMSAIGRYAGTSPTASSIIKNCNDYINAGMPAGRMVIALPTYGRTWQTDNPTYGQTGANPVSASWVDANFNATWRVPAYTKNHSTTVQHQGKWYSFPTPGDTHTHKLATFDDPDTHRIKLDLARDWKGLTSTGAQLGGVAFWSLGWIGQGNAPSSVNPNDSSKTVSSALRRTHSEPWTLWEEMFAPPGSYEFRAETFEATRLNPRWVDPKTSPDNIAVGSSTNILSVAAPAGTPNGKQRVGSLIFNFGSAVNRLFFKFQTLAGTVSPFPTDHSSSLVLVDAKTQFTTALHVPAAYSGVTIRMVVKDGNHQLEKSPSFTLGTAGWQKITWNLADASKVFSYTTAEGGYLSGNGVIDTAGAGVRDIAFVGFEIISNSAMTGTINFGEIRYSFLPPGALEIDETIYDVETSMTLTVLDSDLSGQGSVQVHVASSLEPGGEIVTLGETAVPGIFTGEAFLHYHRPVAGDGLLQTRPADTLTATYQNANDGTGSPSVLTQTATVRVPELIIESRQPGGALTLSALYEESSGFANTTAKSSAPGLIGTGSRYAGTNGVWARFKPQVTVRGNYDVYVTMAGAGNSNATSPGAQYVIECGAESAAGTFNLTYNTPDLGDKWFLLKAGFYFDGVTETSIQITNTNPLSSGTQRFVMDAVRLVLAESHPLPVNLSTWSIE